MGALHTGRWLDTTSPTHGNVPLAVVLIQWSVTTDRMDFLFLTKTNAQMTPYKAIRDKETGVAAKPCAEQLAMAFYIVLRVMTEKNTINILA
ncbi:hypothetical protein CR155_17710 [Pollutimonas nitritireducens]|uniref:Uncharacterized protein n=1 Tax=Pollutimonas nitritireducens TaxID=2045209 RepID=A0A2N4UC86_9BURK|nr:hypothetical protein [Pollutimonas nitritireducens]PLC52625.1 hypothetical protein CR155_17710 [Pollutimonas nitritireducens]